MIEQEIARDIILKMLETNVLVFGDCFSSSEPDEIEKNNEKRVLAVCNAYKAVFQAND